MKKPPTRHALVWARYYAAQLLSRNYSVEQARAETLLGFGGPVGPGYTISRGRMRIGHEGEGFTFDFAALAAPPPAVTEQQLEFSYDANRLRI